MARLVREYGTEFLRRDERAFAKIDEYRHLAMQCFMEEGARFWEMRQAAHKAWQQGNCMEAARLLGILGENAGLTDEEKLMLELGRGSNG